ncbi:MAG: 1-phosphofructokinase family hexose kinase [Tetrasphaera sp.]
MIVTVTLNPSLDLTYTLSEFRLGQVDVHRAETTTLEASGKGVNVSRTLALAGVATTAVLPIGGRTGDHLRDLLVADGLACATVDVPGETRINTSLLLSSGVTVKVNGPGAPLSREAIDAVLAAAGQALDAAGDTPERWLAVCGSFPPGVAPDVVTEFVDLAHRHTAQVVVDISGPALNAAWIAGADLLAPNSLELGELIGKDLGDADAAQVAAAAAELARTSGTEFLVSMGSRGAVFASHTTVLHGLGPALTPVNTAGAGDAFLSGWLAAQGTLPDRMRRALAFGRSACLSPHTVDPHPGTHGVDGLTVHEIIPQKAESHA